MTAVEVDDRAPNTGPVTAAPTCSHFPTGRPMGVHRQAQRPAPVGPRGKSGSRSGGWGALVWVAAMGCGQQ